MYWMRIRTGALTAISLVIILASASSEPPGPSEIPLLPFSTILGGSNSDSADAAAFGPDGVLWIAASSYSLDFPGAQRESGADSGADVVVLRFDPETKSLLSAAWIGSEYSDDPVGLVIDSEGNAYVAGTTRDTASFPVSGGIPKPEGFSHGAFVARCRPDGSGFVWSAVIGGSGNDEAAGIALTADGDPVVCGTTHSPDFPQTGTSPTLPRGNRDAFVARLNADGSGFGFSTRFGGSDLDDAAAVGVTSAGGILVAGSTNSTDFPGEGRLLGSPTGGFEGFLAEFEPDGSRVRRAALLGNSSVAAVDTAESGTLLLLGRTTLDDFPAPHAPHGPPGDDADVYLLRLASEDWEVLGGTLFGGSAEEYYLAMARDPAGRIWIAGSTTSADLPLSGAIRPLLASSEDAFVAAFAVEGTSPLFSTYLGGVARDYAGGLAVAGDGSAWFAGSTCSTDFPTVAPIQDRLGWDMDCDIVLARLLIGDSAARPAVPVELSADVLGGNSVRLRWEDRSAGAASFAVYRREDEGFGRIAVLPVGTTEWVDAGVQPGRGYTYAVQAISPAGGSSASDPVTVDTPETLDIEITRGTWRYKSNWLGGSSRLRLKGVLTPNAGSSDGSIDPVREGIEWIVDFSDADGIWPRAVLAGIPKDDPGWRIGKRRLRWKSHGVSLRIDPRTGKYRLRIKTQGWDHVVEEGARIRVDVGNDSGSIVPVWRSHGSNRRRTP